MFENWVNSFWASVLQRIPEGGFSLLLLFATYASSAFADSILGSAVLGAGLYVGIWVSGNVHQPSILAMLLASEAASLALCLIVGFCLRRLSRWSIRSDAK